MSRRSLFVSMCVMVFLVNMARIMFAPMLEPLRADFGVTKGTVGFLATAVWLGSASPRLFVGLLLTRVPRHYVVLGAGVVLASSSWFASTAGSIEALTVGAFTMGLASGAYFIAGNPLVSELFPERVGQALGLHGGSSQVAAVVASPFVGWALAGGALVGGLALADLAVGPIAFDGTWRTALRVLAVAAAVATAVTAVVISRTELPTAGADDRSLLVALRRQWRIILAGIAFIGATGFLYNGVFNFYVTYLVETKALAEPAARDVLTALFVAGLPAFVLSGMLADRLPNVPYVIGIGLGFAACLLALTATTGFLPLVAVSLVLGLVIHSLFPAMDTYMLSSLPDENRASAYTIYSATMMMIQASGSAVIGQLLDAGFTFDALYQTFAVALTVFLLFLAVLYRTGHLPTTGRPATSVSAD